MHVENKDAHGAEKHAAASDALFMLSDALWKRKTQKMLYFWL